MFTNNYDYNTINVIKIILKNSDNRVLLIQEPEDNNWMPLHWGLPGGKPTEKESLLETFSRKCKTDIGQELKLKGIIKIKELLMDGRTVLMYIVYAETNKKTVRGEGTEYKWVDKKDVELMSVDEFTEYYNKDLLLNFFNENYELVPFSIFNTLEYYKMNHDPKYKKWFKSG